MTNNQSNEPENREQTFESKLDEILLQHGAEEGELTYSLKQAIKTLVLEDVVGDSEVHVSHVCPQDSVGCAKYAQRCATRRHQRQIINPQKEGEQCQHYQA